MHDDVMSFNYTWLMEIVTRMDWKQEMSNLLLIGMKNVVTPAHYDLLENFYLQVQFKWIAFMRLTRSIVTEKTVGTPRVPAPQFNVEVVVNIKNASTLNWGAGCSNHFCQ